MENVLKGNGKIETMKVDEQNIKGIPIVRNFPGVFPEDSTGFIPIYVKLSFVIDLFPLEDYACSKFTLTDLKHVDIRNVILFHDQCLYRSTTRVTDEIRTFRVHIHAIWFDYALDGWGILGFIGVDIH
ncbi:hypothetical protein Tco_0684636 [Tanacetum coccineum]